MNNTSLPCHFKRGRRCTHLSRFCGALRDDFPKTAALFDDMAKEEDSHRAALIALHQERFGETIPLIRREHVAGFYSRRPTWLADTLSLDQMRSEAAEWKSARNAFT